jgi:hypothetical protein
MEQLPASNALSEPLPGQPGSKAQAGKQQAGSALPAGFSIVATATAATDNTGNSPASILPILPRVRCGTDMAGQPWPGAAGPAMNAQHSLVPQQHSSTAGSGNGSPRSVSPVSPRPQAPGTAPGGPRSAASPRTRHAHFASTLPARLGSSVAHGGGAHGVVTPRPAASTRPAAAGSRKRRSSPGHLEARPQSAPLGPAMAAVAVSRTPPQPAATMPLPHR